MRNEKKTPKAKLFSPEYFFFDLVRITGAPGLLWYRPKKIYESEAAKKKIRGPAIIISNHTGVIDPLYIMLVIWYRRHRFICKTELTESRAGFWLKLFRCIPIDRENASFSTMREIVSVLKDGQIVSMFPEGQVGGDDSPAAFKSGMVLMSLRSGAPIVPVYIKPRKRFFERVTAVIGEPFSVCEKYGQRPKFSQIDEAARELHEKEMKLKEILDKTMKGNKNNG